MAIQNKKSGTEDELGTIHKDICRILTHQQKEVLRLIEEEDVSALVAIDPKVMQYMMAWVIKNGIGYAPSESEEQSLLETQLRDVRSRASSALSKLRVVPNKRNAG